MKNKILGMVGFLSFFLLVGSVGGMERGTISILQCLIQSVVGLSVMLISGCFVRDVSNQNSSGNIYERKVRNQNNKKQLKKRLNIC